MHSLLTWQNKCAILGLAQVFYPEGNQVMEQMLLQTLTQVVQGVLDAHHMRALVRAGTVTPKTIPEI